MAFLKPIKATGTIWHIEILDTEANLEALQKHTERFIEDFEQKFSRFRSDSWLSALNTQGTFHAPESEFVDLLQKSLEMYTKTKGVFNIAIGEMMVASGYDHDYSFEEKGSPILPNLMDVLSVSSECIQTTAQLDLGGIGKGYLIDSLATSFSKEFDLKYFVINGGGDIYATSDHGHPISIMLTHPTDTSLSIGTVMLLNQGFASSSPYVRAWTDKKTGEKHNHLQTKNKIASYVIAPDAVSADVWATTLAINPEQNVPEILKKLLIEGVKIIRSDKVFVMNQAGSKNV